MQDSYSTNPRVHNNRTDSFLSSLSTSSSSMAPPPYYSSQNSDIDQENQYLSANTSPSTSVNDSQTHNDDSNCYFQFEFYELDTPNDIRAIFSLDSLSRHLPSTASSNNIQHSLNNTLDDELSPNNLFSDFFLII